MKKTANESRDPNQLLVGFIRYFGYFLFKLIWQIDYKNTENIPAETGKGLLIAPNHQTYLDPFWISIPIRRDMRYMAWDEAFKWFLIGPFIRSLGAFPVSIKRGGTVAALKEALKLLKEGKTLFVFPEGERELADGKLLPFKTGAARLAIEADVPILPVTIEGGNKVWSREHKFPHFGKVTITYHPVIYSDNKLFENNPQENVNLLTNALKETIKRI